MRRGFPPLLSPGFRARFASGSYGPHPNPVGGRPLLQIVRLKPDQEPATGAVGFVPLENDVVDQPEFPARKLMRQAQEPENNVDFRIVPWRVDHDRG